MALRRFLFLLVILISIDSIQAQQFTICWDSSKSMQHRDLEAEFTFLENTFRDIEDAQVELLLFGTDVKIKEYRIKGGDWQALKNDLSEVLYDGVTIFSLLNSELENKSAIIFTDGNQLLKKDFLVVGEGSTIINSSPSGNTKFLNRTALLNRAEFRNLAPDQPTKRVEKIADRIKGTIYFENERLANVPVQILGEETISFTNAKGEFRLDASVTDSIIINNNQDYIYAIKDILGKDLFLTSRVTQLEEVVLTENRKRSESDEEQEKQKQGYAVQSIKDDEINSVNTNLNSAISGRFSGVTTGGGVSSGDDKDLSKFIVRGQSSMLLNNYGLIVVDGVPIKQSNSASDGFQTGDPVASTNFIDPALIEEITVLKGLAATNRFGSLGSNGVLLITTKTAAVRGKDGVVVDQARLRDNIYDKNENLQRPENAPFFKALESTSSVAEAYLNYSSLRALNERNVAFYLESFDYFASRDKSLAARVISNLISLYPEDINVLRALEYYFSYLGQTPISELLNEQILVLDPANLHAHYKKVSLPGQKSAQAQLEEKYALLKGSRTFRKIKAWPIEKTLVRDIKNFVSKNKGRIDLSSIDSELSNPSRYNARFVFEWNNPEAEFELQFVNPQSRYYNWSYSNSENSERIGRGIARGYMIEEFEFYGEESKGTWIVNAKYLGNISAVDNTPFVLRCLVYINFGKPEEQIKEVVIHQTKVNEKQNILKLLVR